MILLFIIFVSFLQFLVYILFEKLKVRIPITLIFLLILGGHYFIFPGFFYPDKTETIKNCGLPILGVLLIFWVFGTFMTFTTHIIWMIRKLKKNENTFFSLKLTNSHIDQFQLLIRKTQIIQSFYIFL